MYPEFPSNEPTVTADEWLKGANVAPKMMKLTPQSTRVAHVGKINFKQSVSQASASQSASKPDHGLNLNSKPTLGYWNIRGNGAQCRYLLHYCGVEFVDTKYNGQDWFDVKFSLGLAHPNLPYLIDEDHNLTETAAICKYICLKWKPELCGRGPVEQTNVEMMWAHVKDLKDRAHMACYGGELSEEGILADCKAKLEQLADWMADKDWVAGKNITWIDFLFWEALEFLDFLAKGQFDAMYPAFAAYR